jgi:hypothetical protein
MRNVVVVVVVTVVSDGDDGKGGGNVAKYVTAPFSRRAGRRPTTYFRHTRNRDWILIPE